MYLGVSKNIFVDKVVVGRLHKRYVKKSWLKKSYTVSVGKFSHFSQGTWFKLLELDGHASLLRDCVSEYRPLVPHTHTHVQRTALVSCSDHLYTHKLKVATLLESSREPAFPFCPFCSLFRGWARVHGLLHSCREHRTQKKTGSLCFSIPMLAP